MTRPKAGSAGVLADALERTAGEDAGAPGGAAPGTREKNIPLYYLKWYLAGLTSYQAPKNLVLSSFASIRVHSRLKFLSLRSSRSFASDRLGRFHSASLERWRAKNRTERLTSDL